VPAFTIAKLAPAPVSLQEGNRQHEPREFLEDDNLAIQPFFRSGHFRPSRFLKTGMDGNGQTLANWLSEPLSE
jgi:hypothetical protein